MKQRGLDILSTGARDQVIRKKICGPQSTEQGVSTQLRLGALSSDQAAAGTRQPKRESQPADFQAPEPAVLPGEGQSQEV